MAEDENSKEWFNSEKKVLFIYFLLSFLWIVLSDRFLAYLVEDKELNLALQTYKGWLYVFVVGAFIYFEKIMAKKRSDTDLQKYKAVVENAPFGVALFGPDYYFINANKRFCEILGYSEIELKKLTFKDLTHPEELETCIKELGELQENVKNSFSITKRCIRKDKEIIYTKLMVGVVRNENMSVKHYVVEIDDVTKVKQNEDSLRQSEEKFHSLFSNATEGIAIHELIFDGKGKAVNYKILDVNEAYKSHTGIEVSKAEGVLATDLYKTKEAPYLLEYSTVSQTGTPRKFEVFFEPLNKYFSISAFSLGKTRFVTVFEDVTKQRQLDKMKKDFVSLASHQLRTPLTGVKWFAELVRDKSDSMGKEEIKKYMKSLSESNQRMIDLVNDLLSISRIESGNLKTEDWKSVSLKKIFESIVVDQSKQIKDKKIKVKGVDKISESLKIGGDEAQIFAIFENIFDNAVKYSKKDSIVEVSTTKQNDSVEVVISDHGLGIPEDQKKKLFEKFFRADNISGNIPGSGLGLYIVKNLVDIYGGSIKIESTEGLGTKVCVMLPLITNNTNNNGR